MKSLFKKVVSVGVSAALTLSMAAIGISSASAATYYYNTYSTVKDILNRSSCTAMQGMAVGSTYLYTVKIKTDNSGAVLQKTNKNTGATTNLTNSTGSVYNYLNHANDMDVATIDGYSQLFVATMATGSNSLVRIKVNGSKATKSGGYTIKLNGEEKYASAVSVESTTSTTVNLLLKVGTQIYRGSVAKSATSGTINITPAFKINISSVRVNGSTLDLSKYTHQGMGYYDGKLFVPLWGGGASKSNQSIIAVYNTKNASGTIKSDPNLSFRITSSAYTGFEIESCDISSDGKLYFNANRWKASTGNCDGVFSFNNYKYNSSIFTEPTTVAPTTVAPTTVAPTTVAPTVEPTEAPTTVAPTEEPTEAPTTAAVTQPTTAASIYFPACSSSCTTIIAGLKSIGVDSSLTYRKTIAKANGITNYTGTATQNTNMLNLLKKGKLINPDAPATEATTTVAPTTVAPTTVAPTTVAPTTVAPTTASTKYFAKCSSSCTTIVAGLNSIGAQSSYSYRKTIAAANGITNYSGTAAQNAQMLNLLKQGKLIVP